MKLQQEAFPRRGSGTSCDAVWSVFRKADLRLILRETFVEIGIEQRESLGNLQPVPGNCLVRFHGGGSRTIKTGRRLRVITAFATEPRMVRERSERLWAPTHTTSAPK